MSSGWAATERPEALPLVVGADDHEEVTVVAVTEPVGTAVGKGGDGAESPVDPERGAHRRLTTRRRPPQPSRWQRAGCGSIPGCCRDARRPRCLRPPWRHRDRRRRPGSSACEPHRPCRYTGAGPAPERRYLGWQHRPRSYQASWPPCSGRSWWPADQGAGSAGDPGAGGAARRVSRQGREYRTERERGRNGPALQAPGWHYAGKIGKPNNPARLWPAGSGGLLEIGLAPSAGATAPSKEAST